MKKMKVFIAHDTGDQLIADTLVSVLKDWFGKRLEFTYSAQFEAGDWRDKIKDALLSGDLLLALRTPRSIGNRWVHFEAGAFYGRKQSVIPLLAGNLRVEDFPDPLNTFTSINLENEADLNRLAQTLTGSIKQISKRSRAKQPANPGQAVLKFRAIPKTGVAKDVEKRLIDLWDALQLEANARARVVLSHASEPYGLAVDDLIILYASPNWDGLHKPAIRSVIEGSRTYHPEVSEKARTHQDSRPDKDDNKAKLGLVRIDPFMSDRDHLGLGFERMFYFDFEGPRRSLFEEDIPTRFATTHYLGKQIPDDIPTPLACVHTILITEDDYLVFGLRLRRTKTDFYENRLSVGFEEQMSGDDEDIFATVKRGLREEAGISGIVDNRIQLLALGLEASFFSIAAIAIARLECDSRELHTQIQMGVKDHEWDAIFIPNETKHLVKLLKTRLPQWEDLNSKHYLNFTPSSEYQWHGTSRFRLFAYLAKKEGIGRLAKLV
jgi:hypothetical protein